MIRFLLLSSLVVCGGIAPSRGSQKPAQPSKSPPEFQRLASDASKAREANRTEEAIGLYRKALKLDLRWNEGWWYLGTLYYDGDHYKEGTEAFHNLVELTPEYGPGWAMLGLCEFELH